MGALVLGEGGAALIADDPHHLGGVPAGAGGAGKAGHGIVGAGRQAGVLGGQIGLHRLNGGRATDQPGRQAQQQGTPAEAAAGFRRGL